MPNIFDQFDAPAQPTTQPAQANVVAIPVQPTPTVEPQAPQNVFDQFDNPVQEGDPNEIVKRGTILPLGLERGGDLTLALPEILEGPRQTIVDLIEGRRTAQDVTGEEVLNLGLVLGGAGGARTMTTTGNRGLKLPAPKQPTPKAAPAPAPAPKTPGAEVAEAGARIGVELPRAATSDALGVQGVGRTAANIPIGGTPLRKASQEAIEQLGKAADDAQSQLGSGSVESAGGQLRAGIETQITEASAARVSAKFDRVAGLVDETVTAPLDNTLRTAIRIGSRRGEAGISGDSQAVALVNEALSRPGGLSYQGTKDLRTSIGQMLDNPSALPANFPKAELKQIYGALTKDLRNVVSVAGGGRARQAFDAANAFTARQANINKRLNTVLKTQSNEGAFAKIVATAGSTSRADVSLLRRVRGAVDRETWNEIGSAVVSRLGRDAEGQFSPARFVTAWGKLTSEGKRVLFRSTGRGDVAGALDDIAIVSSRFKRLDQFANPSGTGQTIFGGATLLGGFVDPLTAATSILGARVVSSLLARPSTVKGVANWAKAYERAAIKPGPTTTRVLENQSQRLGVIIAKELDVPEVAIRIGRELQGPVPSAADSNEDDGIGEGS